MDCWDLNYCAYPWPVELDVSVDGANWVPFLGSLLLFLASLAASGVAWYGIRKSNETNRHSNDTNRDAIAAADARELTKWRREIVLKLTSEAATAALDLEQLIHEVSQIEKGRVFAQEGLNEVGAASKRLRHTAETLLLIGADDLSEGCKRIWDKYSSAASETLGPLINARHRYNETVKEDIEKYAPYAPGSQEVMEEGYRSAIVDKPLAAFNTLMQSAADERRKFVGAAQRHLNPATQTAEQLSDPPPPVQADG